MTVPTKLTVARIVVAFIVMALMFVPGWVAKSYALAGFLLASFTDWLDGWLARRRHETSALGALLDPIADKVLVLGTFLTFVQLRMVPAWMVLVIFLRESLITGVRLIAANRHVVLPAAKEGKQKTASQMLTLVFLFVALIIQELPGRQLSPAAETAMATVIRICLWVTTVLTMWSGASFFWRHRAILRDVASHL
jgi:CDP-diacylglycerol--glycerol-3-phosphate 3-phosphatidyltransferase